jgi:hypothetical protein
MPNALSDVVATWPCACFCCTFSCELDPSILFEVPDTFRKQAGSHEVEEARRNNEEDLQRRFVAALVDEESDQGTCTKTAKNGKRKAGRRRAEPDTCNKPGCLLSICGLRRRSEPLTTPLQYPREAQ